MSEKVKKVLLSKELQAITNKKTLLPQEIVPHIEAYIKRVGLKSGENIYLDEKLKVFFGKEKFIKESKVNDSEILTNILKNHTKEIKEQ